MDYRLHFKRALLQARATSLSVLVDKGDGDDEGDGNGDGDSAAELEAKACGGSSEANPRRRVSEAKILRAHGQHPEL